MKVIFTGAGPGDPELLTVKARRLLENCRVCIYAGSLVSPEVLALLPNDAEKHDSASLSLEETTLFAAKHRNADSMSYACIRAIRRSTAQPASR